MKVQQSVNMHRILKIQKTKAVPILALVLSKWVSRIVDIRHSKADGFLQTL